MYGWINDCVEKLVVEKFGRATWLAIKEAAGLSEFQEGDFIRLEHYPDKMTFDLVAAASKILCVEQAAGPRILP